MPDPVLQSTPDSQVSIEAWCLAGEDQGRAVMTVALGTLVKLIRKYGKDDAERRALAIAHGRVLVEVVNDPTWGVQSDG